MPLPNDVIAKLAECAHADFESTRDVWFGRGAISTFVVALGLLIELPELVYELKSIARENIPRLKYRVVIRENRVHVAKVVAFVGWMLIAGGVFGEWYTGNRVNHLDASIQACSTARLTEATLNAGDAKTSATSAESSAKALLGMRSTNLMRLMMRLVKPNAKRTLQQRKLKRSRFAC